MAAANAATAGSTADREIVLTRVFEAPRDLVFQAWTDSIHIVQWWGPTGFRTTIYEMDVRPGGIWRFTMHGPDGRDYKNKIIFRDIVKNERLTYTHIAEGEDTNQFEVTVTFAAEGQNTKLTLHMVFPTPAERDRVVKEYGAIEGGRQTLERLAQHLTKMAQSSAQPGNDPLVINRIFDAPRALVFTAWTDPEHLKRWWGPAGCEIGTCKVDLRPDGSFLYSIRMPNGPEMWGKFVYREITPPERLVFLSCFSGPNGNIARHPFSPTWPLEILNTVTFAEETGKTRLTLLANPVNATPEELKTFYEGRVFLEKGLIGSFEQLAAHLAKA
jgi:uncharacterized protein YndB with AHSA1/START domain